MNIQKLISDQSVTRTLTSDLQNSSEKQFQRDSMKKQKDESEEK